MTAEKCLVQLNTSVDVIREAAAVPTAATLGPLAAYCGRLKTSRLESPLRGAMCHGGAAVDFI